MADEEGKYLTSFLEIFVDTDKDLSNLAKLAPNELGTYYHEYFHYIQDVTTASGLSKVWNAFNRLYHLAASFQSEEDLDFPLDNAVAQQQQTDVDFLKKIRGSGQLTSVNAALRDSYEIDRITEDEDELLKAKFPSNTPKHIKLCLVIPTDPSAAVLSYDFGEAAISESMAYLIERKFFPGMNDLPKYPYGSATAVARHIYPHIAQNEELIFALCDTALLHNVPGWAFVEIVKEMEKQGFQPVKGEDVIDFGRNLFEKMGWDDQGYMYQADEAMQKISKAIYNHPKLAPTVKLLQLSIERGRLLRLHYPYKILEIYRGKDPLSPVFYKTWNFLGGPHTVDRGGNRVIRIPVGHEDLADTAHPQHLRVAWQFNQLFMKGVCRCSLIEMCRASNNTVVDDRCEYSPWKRAEEDPLCPYAAAWVGYGLHKKNVYLDGKLIQQKLEDPPQAK